MGGAARRAVGTALTDITDITDTADTAETAETADTTDIYGLSWCAAVVDLALVFDKPVFAIMSGPQTETTLCMCRSHGGMVYRRAGWQSAGVVVVLTQPICIDQWTRRCAG